MSVIYINRLNVFCVCSFDLKAEAKKKLWTYNDPSKCVDILSD